LEGERKGIPTSEGTRKKLKGCLRQCRSLAKERKNHSTREKKKTPGGEGPRFWLRERKGGEEKDRAKGEQLKEKKKIWIGEEVVAL